ncbi:MAG: hypothetical protein PHO20_01230 [Candidatus Peribacteraceae bacterium]|jgi:hypothetical protein|nr:hypothetical protein [Candidatus Peribacteraceae bacterium]MDD5739370.1 hypothetical protein [Candidatus Peribacteraceae bacterium]
MTQTPELYWKIRVQEGSSTRFEFLNAVQIETRRRLGQILPGETSEVNAYVRIGPANYESLASWRRRQRGR